MSGYLAPFQPKGEQKPQEIRQLSTFPIIESALEWLLKQGLILPKEVAGFPEFAKETARTMSRVEGAPMISRLNEAVRESLAAGEGAELWRERLNGFSDLQASLTETIQRTATHRAYLEGQDEVIRTAGLEDEFEFYQYFATDDGRARKEHVELDEKVFHRDSPMAARAAKQLADWNCRCTRIAITREDAEYIGIEPGQEGPPPKPKKEAPIKAENPMAGFVIY